MRDVTVTGGWTLRREASRHVLVSSRREGGLQVALPFGIAYHHGDLVAVSVRGDDLVVRLHRAGQSAVLYPPFRRRFRLSRLGIVWVVQVTERKDRDAALALIGKEHYLPPPRAGVFLVARHRGRVVGAAVLGVLNHAVPVGRRRFLGAARRTPGLPVFSWARRFAVERRYHGYGVGRALATSCIGVASRHLVPRPIAVEVITMKRERFLIDAGYVLVCVTLGRRMLRDAPGRTVKTRNYYYAQSVRPA